MIRANATLVDLSLIASRATPLPVEIDVAAAPGRAVGEGVGGTYVLVGSRDGAVLLELEARNRRLVTPIPGVLPHILFE